MATKKSADDATTTPDAAPELIEPAPASAPEPETAAPVTGAPVPAADHVNAPAVATTPKRTRAPKTVAAPAAPAASAPPVATPAPAVDEVPVESVPVTEEPITASSDPETVVLAETTPDDHPAQQVIVVDAPIAPKKHSNRLVGIGFALLATLVFIVLFAVAVFAIGLASDGRANIGFLLSPMFYWPAVLFFLALVIVIAVVNTAGWWSYIITSVVVAAGVYFGTAAVLLVSAGVLSMSQQQANAVYFEALTNPLTIAAALIAREVAIWTGAILGRRGRKVRARNVEAREAFEREQAELAPTQ